MGGKSRYESVRNGIRSIRDEDALVAIHDGARPFISAAEIRRAFQLAAEKGNAVFSVLAKDSLRQVEADGGSHYLDRSKIHLVQTPQIFHVRDMRPVYEKDDNPLFTDDATVMEMAGSSIFLCQGSYENLKVTTPEDWILADKILQQRSLHNQNLKENGGGQS
jgi:2-C-methyl-D-erythritol 4-phosphate cytidylyltransferase